MALNDGIVKMCVAVGMVTTLLTLLTCGMPYWRVSDQVSSESYMRSIWAVEGLWIRCTSNMEMYSCDTYDTTMIGLPRYITGFRALMVVSVIFSFAGSFMSVFGMRCFQALEDDSPHKRYVVLGSGGCHIVAGGLTLLCVSWYAAEVVKEFSNPLYDDRSLKYTFGVCLYLGWLASVLSLLAGFLLVCCHIRSDEGEDTRGRYKPPMTSNIPMTQAYVQNNAPIYTRGEPQGRRSRRYSENSRRYSTNYQDDYNTKQPPTDGYV